MATSAQFAAFVAEQLGLAGTIHCRKMFGEYGLYCDGKFFAVICDDQLYLKLTDAGQRLMPETEPLPPYDGWRPMLPVVELDDREFLAQLVQDTCKELPFQKPRRRKRNG